MIEKHNLNWSSGHYAHRFEEGEHLLLMELQVNRIEMLSGPQSDNLERRKHSCLQKYPCEDLEITYVADTHQHDLN